MKESFEAKMDAKGRILVPVYFRDRLGAKKGDKFNVEIEKEEDLGDKCLECGLPATHPSGLCRDCHQSKLEAEG